jgi:hypothetical protein
MEDILHRRIMERLIPNYDRRLMNNVDRGRYVEAMIALALEDSWHPTSEDWDWAPWDLESTYGSRIEIKHSAALQSWSVNLGAPRPSPPRFDIAHRERTYTKGGGRWPIYIPGRPSDIYLFAWHPETNPSIADHRRSEQWRFYVVPKDMLPERQQTIGLNPVRRIRIRAVGRCRKCSCNSVIVAKSQCPSLAGRAATARRPAPA